MTKWDTIQSDIADAYIGIEETLAWEEAISNDPDYFDDDEIALALDWEE